MLDAGFNRARPDSVPKPVRSWWLFCLSVLLAFTASSALAHGVTGGDAGYIHEVWGVQLGPFVYLGAKHMVTGYDHLLFLLGVIFYLYNLKHVAVYVSLFALGHSITMLLGYYFHWGLNAYLVDAIIGLSIVYKALDNMGVYEKWFGIQPDTKAATFVFGLFHGLGLSSRLMEFEISEHGLWPNLIAFNVGVEIGQILALAAILIGLGFWRRTPGFGRQAYNVNVALCLAGLVLTGLQLTSFLAQKS